MDFEGIKNFLLDIIETVVIALSIFVVIYLLAFQPHEIKGQSMDGIAGFHDGQYLLTDKLTYRFREPERGEVIVFKYPLNESVDYIKRVIAIPGDKIMLKDNKIYLYTDECPEGVIVNESAYIAPTVQTNPKTFLKEGVLVRVPEDNYFVMGDNREHSSDSRAWGFVERDEIIGRSLFRYWPPNEIGLIDHPQTIPEKCMSS